VAAATKAGNNKNSNSNGILVWIASTIADKWRGYPLNVSGFPEREG